MAYINQNKKATIAANLKPVLSKYGMKGSLSIRNHSTVVLTLTSGPIDFEGKGVNVYWVADHFDGIARAFLLEALAALKSAGWYDRSNAMADHFDTAYYVDIKVGRWDKPYMLASAVRVAA